MLKNKTIRNNVAVELFCTYAFPFSCFQNECRFIRLDFALVARPYLLAIFIYLLIFVRIYFIIISKGVLFLLSNVTKCRYLKKKTAIIII